MPLTCDTHPGENPIEIVIGGPVTDADVRVAREKVVGFIGRHSEINVIEIVREFTGTDPATLWDGLPREARIHRVAVVSAGGCQSALCGTQARVFRAFPPDQIDAARIWAHRGP